MADDATVAPDANASTRPLVQWAFFVCGERGFAIPLDRVSEIVTPQPATRLPGAGQEVLGLVGFRGRVITVFDLGVLTGGAAVRSTEDHRLIFVARGGRLVGIGVDAMVTIAAADGLDDAPPALPGTLDANDVRGTVIHEGRRFLRIDVDHLLGRLLA